MNRKMKLFAIGIAILILSSSIVSYCVVATNIVAAKPIRVACVGDSITDGSGYPNKLNLLLGSNYVVGNFGVTGSTVSVNSKKPYMVQPEFQEAKDFQPDIVIIMLGTNDANLDITPNDQSFEVDYTELVTSFQELEGNQKIFVVKSPPIFTNNPSYNNTYLANTVIPRIDRLADQLSLSTIDVYSAFGNHIDYFMDGVHPDSDGATLIAATVCIAITEETIY